MIARKSNSDDKTRHEAATTEPPAALDHQEDDMATSPATPAEDASPEVEQTTEQAAAPDADPSSTKKNRKAKRARRAKARKDSGAKRKQEQGPQEDDAAKVTETPPPDGKPNLRCLTIARDAVPPLPAGTLPPQIEKLFPDPASRAAPVCALLAAAGAAAGHAVGLVAGIGAEHGGMLSLRVAVISDTFSLNSLIEPVLQAAYAVQAAETKAWIAEKQKEDGQAAVIAVRQRLHRQTAANAAILGFVGLAETEVAPTAMLAPSRPRPCFVLRDPAPTAAKQALANASKGVLIADGTKSPAWAGWGAHFLTDLADLLNDANAGELLELADPLAHGAVRMRNACVSVISRSSTIETFSLYKAKSKAMASTVLVPVESAPKTIAANAAKVVTAMLARLRALHPEDDGGLRRLRLSTDARKLLEQAKRKLTIAANAALPPLAVVYADAADLMVKVAALWHLLGHAVGDADQLPLEIGKDAMVRAVAFVDQYALPAARHVLGPSSIDPIQRDARRVLSFAQQNQSADNTLVFNDVARRLVHSMKRDEIRQAIGLLVDDGLLTLKTPGGSQSYTVDPVVFAVKNRLPDLAGDPRRPKH